MNLTIKVKKVFTVVFLALSLVLTAQPAHAKIPSAQGDSNWALGLGLPNLVHGSARFFVDLNDTYGVGIGSTGHLLVFGIAGGTLFSHYLQFRFYKNEGFAASVFYENGAYEISSPFSGGVSEPARFQALGVGISYKTEWGRLNANISLTDDPLLTDGTLWIPDTISGVEIVFNNGFFISFPAYFGQKTVF